MKTWSFYDSETGRFRGTRYSAKTDKDLGANTPAGCAAYEGSIDWRTKRFDIDKDEIVDDEALIAQRAVDKSDRIARSTIKELEALQLRPLRELALGDETAKYRIEQIDLAIAEQRVKIKPTAQKGAK